MRERARLAHQADARVRPAVALERDRPREASRRHVTAEVDLDARRTVERLLELGALHERARHAEAELPVEAIVRAAGEDAAARVDARAAVDVDRDARSAHVDRAHAHAAPQLGAGRAPGVGEPLVECRAIDDGRRRALRVHGDRAAVGGDERREVRGGQDGAPRQVELGEGVEAEDAGAVYGKSDLAVLLEHDDIVAARRQDAGGGESRRAGADYRDITHGCRSVFAPAHFPCAKHANPK